MATNRKGSSKNKNGKGKQSASSRRRSPGSSGRGEYYHIELRPDEDFATFRTQDVGDPGHIQRVAGKREGGSWATVKWLIGKEDAHVEDGALVGDTKDAKDLLKKLRSKPVHKGGDRFTAKPRSRSAGVQKKGSSKSSRKTQTSRSR